MMIVYEVRSLSLNGIVTVREHLFKKESYKPIIDLEFFESAK